MGISYYKASDFSFQTAFFKKIARTFKRKKDSKVLRQSKHLNSAKTLLAAPK